MQSALTILAGDTAFERIASQGLSPQSFGAVVGASGGAKMLALTHLDRYIFGEFLPASEHRVELVGSSIGAWRHAAAATRNPIASLTALQERYLNQSWDENDPRPRAQIVDELCDWVLNGFYDDDTARQVCEHPRYVTHIVTARGRGLNGAPASPLLGLGLAGSATLNTLHRSLLSLGFQRVVFSAGPSLAFSFRDFATEHVALTPALLKIALLASGSIPFLMSGQHSIPGAPRGRYWDGGIVDYHFDLSNLRSDELVLYPHFGERVVKGWFDKALPWRFTPVKELSNVLLVAPSLAYLERLPHGRIPDRKDFKRMDRADRLRAWKHAMSASQALADSFADVVNAADPVRYIARFGGGKRDR
ncbi:MAG: patatin-like phospholipase family protein [Pseudomonadota bacterium]